MIKRFKQLPQKSFLLLGPRGVGKSTLIRQQIKPKVEINLLLSREYISFSQNPDLLENRLGHLKSGEWAFIDEVQRVPEILNVIHDLYEKRRLHFAITGSSARKIKRSGGNLLAGRALQSFLYPFVYPEFQKYISIDEAIDWGTLPLVVTEKEHRQETLATYVETYLKEELIHEGLIRKTESFLRFLQVAGILNGQSLNFETVARESHIARTTVQTYFEILIDTLIGFYLPSYQPGLKVKESAKPKFYYFDTGVARASAGLISYDLDPAYRGFLFENFMINQVRAYNEYTGKKLNLAYYGISKSGEIDLIIETKKRMPNTKPEIIAIEFKLGSKFKQEWLKSFSLITDTKKINVSKKICVYTGQDTLTFNDIQVISAEEFLKNLFTGKVF